MANIIDESIINLDPDKINFEDKDEVKAIFIAFLNTIEHLVQENIRLREENQQLKDEIARLMGEKGKPRIKSNVPAREPSIPKTRPKNWSKGSKKDKVKIDREVTVPVDCPLPTDARFVGYRKVVIQDVVLKTDNVAYLLERYYSQSLNNLNSALRGK